MTVDVLMPAKNAGRYVSLAIRSTFESLRSEDRILVMDDGSTDDTASILTALQQRYGRRLVVSRNSASQGVASSLNSLLDMSTAKIVARMDADDICLPWRFKVQLADLASAPELLFGGYVTFGSAKSLVKQPLPIAISNAAAIKIILKENPFCHPTLVCRRESLVAIGGYMGGLAEDYLTWLEAIRSGISVRRSGIPVLMYRVSAAQTSGTWAWKEHARSEVVRSSAWTSLSESGGAGMDDLSWVERRIVRRINARSSAG